MARALTMMVFRNLNLLKPDSELLSMTPPEGCEIWGGSQKNFECKEQLVAGVQNLFLDCKRRGAFSDVRKFEDWLGARARSVAILTRGSEVLSFGFLKAEGTENHPGFKASIDYVMTTSGEEGNGYATTILKTLLRLAYTDKIPIVELYCDATNERLVHTYEHAGFIGIHTQSVDFPRTNA